MDQHRRRTEQVDQFRHDLAPLTKPVYVHSAGSERCAAFALMAWAVKNGVSGDQALERAASLGIDLKAESADFVRAYVDQTSLVAEATERRSPSRAT